jgi:hypothetical protein
MATTAQKQLSLHFSCLPPWTKKALDFFSKQIWLKDAGWYLAGGTALALNAGNRRSFDLDFFSERSNFENDEVLQELKNQKSWKVTMNRKNTIYGELFGAKVSFIAYPFFAPNQSPIFYGNVRILDPHDIAVMKIIAISQRGRKRDFFDLFWCTQYLEPLEKTLKRLKKQYPETVHDYHHILKALVYFADAESDPEPEIYFQANWRQVKKFFTSEILLLTKKLLKI